MNRSYNIIKAFNFFIYGALSVYSTFFALYLQKIGWSTLEIGALLAGGPIVSIVANPLWGYLSDRFRNIRLVILIMMAGATVIMQIVFLAQSDTVIYTAMLFFFFFQMPMFSQSNSLILNAIEGTKYKFGSFRLWGSMGWAVLAAASGPIIGQIGIERLWILYTAMMLMSILFAFGLPKGESKVAVKSEKTNYRSIFANKAFLLFLLLGLVLSIPNSMNQTFIALYIAELGGQADMIGWAAFFSSIFEIPVFLLLDRYLKRNTKTMMFCMIFVSVLFTLRWALMAGADSGLQIIFVQLLHCVTFGGFYYIGTQLTALLVPAQYRASGQAVYALIYGGVSGMAAGIIGGWLFQNMGAQSMYVSGAIMALIGVAGFAALYGMVRRSGAAVDGASAG
ncbi:MFS transporter [Paenibacillus sp. 1011MAR3C5]|uniref:MFS transporter n=1 Tax=Paenibacillus sp. 1011MAR3C5 TaxID=1675787 RepID=UPI000E6BF543|nr:MFS transporter [Paenibacillus sp. 1011MAR3C5]RJE88543.1 MFS transporter [Paenibacillus sp. 1011MAR3C5]